MNKLVRLFVLAGLCSSGAYAQETVLPNKTPDAGSVQITPNTGLCTNGNNYLFSEFTADDPDGHQLTITGVTSSDESILSSQSVSYYTMDQNGNTSSFEVTAYNAQPGTVDLTFTISDGEVSIEVTATVVFGTPEAVTFIDEAFTVCADAGIINLDDYVTVPGGEFQIGEGTVPTLLDLSDYAEENYVYIHYKHLQDGCEFESNSEMTIADAPVAQISVVASPGCGTTNGELSAQILGEETYTYAWSNGVQQELSISGLAPGIYYFNVTDNTSGCSATAAKDLQPTGVEIEALTVTDLTCFGSNDGAISIEVSGMTAPYTYYWSSGHTGSSISGLPAGIYTVTVQNETGCIITDSYQINQPEAMEVYTYSDNATCGNADGVFYAEAHGGDGNYTYLWSTGSVESQLNEVIFGTYFLTVTDGAGCTATTTAYMSEQSQIYIYGEATPTTCGGSNGSIDVDIDAFVTVESILWSNGATTEDISGLAAGTYVCTVTSTEGCKSIRAWTLEAESPLRNDICIVTVDSLTTTNLVVWEKLQTTGISHYNIYRETAQSGQYMLIDTVNYNNLSVFNDVVASPKVRSWRYKISAVNTCGQEGPLSAHHKTLHLNAFEPNEGSVLITWDAYEGTAYTSYDLWRFTSEEGWGHVATVPANQLNYTDLIDFSTPGLDYLVEMTPAEGCMVEKAQDFNTSRSNKEKGLFVPGTGTGNSNNGLHEFGKDILVNVYPNPVQDKLMISLDGAIRMDVSFQDIQGKVVLTQQLFEGLTSLDMQALGAGVYFVNLHVNGISEVVKIVKQ